MPLFHSLWLQSRFPICLQTLYLPCLPPRGKRSPASFSGPPCSSPRSEFGALTQDRHTRRRPRFLWGKNIVLLAAMLPRSSDSVPGPIGDFQPAPFAFLSAGFEGTPLLPGALAIPEAAPSRVTPYPPPPWRDRTRRWRCQPHRTA